MAVALQVELVEESFDMLVPQGEELVARFYQRLLMNQEVEPLFRHVDMKRQQQMLLNALLLVRGSLREPEKLVPVLQALGAKHVSYGAKPEFYPIVGTTLVATMQEVAGANWKPEYTTAWVDAFQVIQDTMLSGTTVA
jgi:methyl-accepting chemotaxis protein